MKLTILGTSAAYPGPNTPCSGYLVQDKDRNVLVDCGTGAIGNLQAHLDLRNVTDIVITHMHADHFFDLVPYRYALRYGLENSNGHHPQLHLPPRGTEALNQVVSSFSESDSFFPEVFNVSEYEPERTLELGHLTVRFVPVRHYIPTYALSISGSKKLAYSSDSGHCLELLDIASNADLFLCNVGRCLGKELAHLWGHLLPEEAGMLAKKAGARRLMIAHLWPNCDQELSLAKASNTFDGQAEMAEIHRTYTL